MLDGMTNIKASEVLIEVKYYAEDLAHYSADDVAEALDMAIKALEQQPCDDCISREAVQDLISRWLSDYLLDETREALETINYKIGDMPPVTPERPKGKWIIKDGKEQGYDIAGIKTWYIQILCDKCGFIKTAIEGHTGQYHYCPNCGAEMSGGGDDGREQE